ncbi:hypothetical protein CS379_05005, partial [Methylobacterium frigidaeris]
MDPSLNSGTRSSDLLLAALYGSITRDDALPTMLDLLAARFRCRSAAFFYADRLLPLADVVRGHGLFDESAQRRYRDGFAHPDPLPGLMTRLPVGRAAASDRLFSPDEILALPFIREFYHPLGLREALGGPVVNEEGRLGIVSVHRGSDREPFGDDEIRDFEALIPHLAQAVQLRRRFFAIADEAQAAADALDATVLAVPGGCQTSTGLYPVAGNFQGDGSVDITGPNVVAPDGTALGRFINAGYRLSPIGAFNLVAAGPRTTEVRGVQNDQTLTTSNQTIAVQNLVLAQGA